MRNLVIVYILEHVVDVPAVLPKANINADLLRFSIIPIGILDPSKILDLCSLTFKSLSNVQHRMSDLPWGRERFTKED